MSTIKMRGLGRTLLAPSIVLLVGFSILPLAASIWYSLLNYNLQDPTSTSWAGLENYAYFLSDPDFLAALTHTFILVFAVLAITVFFGTLIAMLLDQPILGRSVVRILVITPFFVMPTVSAMVWKNLLMDPERGFLTWAMGSLGFNRIDWFSDYPLFSIIVIVAWQWLPFATLILLTALQSMDAEQKEAAEMDGAPAFSQFFYLTLPHLARPMTVVILIETIFLLNIFAEIYTTGARLDNMNLAYLIYRQALLLFDVGSASAGGLVAVVLANFVAIFLVRIVGKNLEA